MRLITILFSAILFMAACQNNAQERSGAPAGNTTIQWLDSVVDKGKITEGQKIEIPFRFKNTGANPLVIQSVQPGCGCTVADYPKQPIAPGGEGVIKGFFDSKGRPGLANKTMTVYANTDGRQHHTLTFIVNVEPQTQGSNN